MYDWITALTDAIHSITNIYWNGNFLYLAVFIISVTTLIFFNKKKKDSRQILVAYTIVLLLLVVYNTWFTNWFVNIPFSGEAVVARFWILAPVWLIISFALARIVSLSTNTVKKTALSLSFALILVLSGESVITNRMMQDSQNYYKIKSEAVLLADEILRVSCNEPVRVVMFIYRDGDDNFQEGGNIAAGIRQYTADIEFYTCYLADDEWESCYMADVTPDGKYSGQQYLNREMRVLGNFFPSDYVVYPDDERLVPMMDYLGYKPVGYAAGYCIYTFDESAIASG